MLFILLISFFIVFFLRAIIPETLYDIFHNCLTKLICINANIKQFFMYAIKILYGEIICFSCVIIKYKNTK